MRYVLIILLLLSVVQAVELEKVSLQLKWKHQFQFAGFLMAKEKGFYRDVGLEVDIKEFHQNTDIIKDVENNITDFGISDSALIYDVISGKKLSALMAIFQHSPFLLLGLKSSGIKTLQDTQMATLALYEGIDGIAIQTMLESKKITYIPHPPVFSLQKLISGKIDMMSAYISNEPYTAKLQGLETVTFSPKDYGFEGYGDILFTSQEKIKNHPKTVHKMYQASYKGWEYAFTHIDETVDILYKKYNTQAKTKEAFKYEANKLKELSGYGHNFGNLNQERVKSIGQLFNLLKHENNRLEELDDFIYHDYIDSQDFTKEEKEYLKTKKTLNVCVRKNLKPYIIKDTQGYSGISVDLLNNISKKLNLKTNYIYNELDTDYYNNFRTFKCDVGALILTKPNKFYFLTPTTPYISDKMVIATSINQPYISDFNKLKNKKIMMQKGHRNVIKYVKKIHPNFNLVEVDNFDLARVSSGEFYGAIEPYSRLLYLISSSSDYRIKIMGRIGKNKLRGSFGVSNNEPILLKILNKTIKKIPKKMIEDIERKYSIIKIEEHINYFVVFYISFASLIIISIILKLYFKQKKLAKIVKQEKEKFENIFYNASDGTSIITDGVLTDCNDSLIKILGYENKNQLLNLIPSQLSPKYQPDGNKSSTKYAHMLSIALKNGVNAFEWKHSKANGEEFWADIVLTSISKNDKVIHAIWRNIQFKKEMENELLELNTSLEEKVK